MMNTMKHSAFLPHSLGNALRRLPGFMLWIALILSSGLCCESLGWDLPAVANQGIQTPVLSQAAVLSQADHAKTAGHHAMACHDRTASQETAHSHQDSDSDTTCQCLHPDKHLQMNGLDTAVDLQRLHLSLQALPVTSAHVLCFDFDVQSVAQSQASRPPPRSDLTQPPAFYTHTVLLI